MPNAAGRTVRAVDVECAAVAEVVEMLDMGQHARRRRSSSVQVSAKVDAVFDAQQIKTGVEHQGPIKVDQDPFKSVVVVTFDNHTQPMFSIRRLSTTAARSTMLGAAAGALIAWSSVAALGASADGAGYGGTAGTLEVVVRGESVHVRGSGFLASSTVVISAGALTTSVVADEFGNIDTTLTGTPDVAVSATGTSPTGGPTTVEPRLLTESGPTTAAAVGAGLGACPAAFRARRRRVR
jgi:hypothetical protein